MKIIKTRKEKKNSGTEEEKPTLLLLCTTKLIITNFKFYFSAYSIIFRYLFIY